MVNSLAMQKIIDIMQQKKIDIHSAAVWYKLLWDNEIIFIGYSSFLCLWLVLG